MAWLNTENGQILPSSEISTLYKNIIMMKTGCKLA